MGYIFMFEDKAFDPNGMIEGVTQEEATIHNKALSQGEIDGLDNACQVGQGNNFYWNPTTRQVKTWIGDLVSDDVTVTKTTVTFRRKGKVLRGHIRADDCALFFKRVS